MPRSGVCNRPAEDCDAVQYAERFAWVAVVALTITHDPVQVAALSVAYTILRLLSLLGIGVVIDRVDRRRLLYLGNFSRGLLFAVLTALVFTETTSMLALYLVCAIMGIIETMVDGAAVSILPHMVPTDRLDHANSQKASAQVVIDEFIGPPLGGFLFGLAIFMPTLLSAVVFIAAGMIYLEGLIYH